MCVVCSSVLWTPPQARTHTYTHTHIYRRGHQGWSPRKPPSRSHPYTPVRLGGLEGDRILNRTYARTPQVNHSFTALSRCSCFYHAIRNIHACNLDCLDDDAFNFPGSRNVTEVDIGNNAFIVLPEKLFWNMTALLILRAHRLQQLQTLPERFFWGQSQLKGLELVEAHNLGAQDRLPNGLFEGLYSLSLLDVTGSIFRNLPSTADLRALVTLLCDTASYGARASLWHMNKSESESKFDGLVRVESIQVMSNALSMVPGTRNLGNLKKLILNNNQITEIAPGDFAGAVSLVLLTLGGNKITSVAAAAFTNLEAFRVTPEMYQ